MLKPHTDELTRYAHGIKELISNDSKYEVYAETSNVTGTVNHISGIFFKSDTYIIFYIEDDDPTIYMNIVVNDVDEASASPKDFTITGIFDNSLKKSLSIQINEIISTIEKDIR